MSCFIDRQFYDKLYAYYQLIQKKLIDDYRGTEPDDEYKRSMKNINKFLINISKVRQFGWREGLKKDILNRTNNEHITFDSQDFQFVFTNKVIDLRTNEEIEPNPADYNTNCCGYDWTPIIQEEYEYLRSIIEQIHPDKVMRDWYYLIMSTGLCGKQIQNMFFFQGTGGNGKSILNSLALAMLGAYGLKVPSKFFLQESDMKPMPEIANAHNVRFCLSQEPNNKKLIVPNVMKEWTGDMVYSVRGIYSSKTQITLKQTQVMEVNDMPNINETTEGVHRRMKFTRFECKAVEQHEYDKFKDKIPNLMLKNSYYTTTDFQQKYRMSFFHLLMEKTLTLLLNPNPMLL